MTSARLFSPFRYPGGKTWLVPLICQWLNDRKPKPAEFIEPFAGGGIIGLNVVFKQLVDHVTFVELDEDVAAVWQTILYGKANDLAERIATFDLTYDSVKEVLSDSPNSIEERAFQTILKNRVNHGGILAPGAGMLKNGENRKGITSRWYPETLLKRILHIMNIRDRITFIRGDGRQVLRQNGHRTDTVFFIDPPYTAASGKKAGTRLYAHFELDHAELFRIASNLVGDFLMTYENAEDIYRLAQHYDFDLELVPMRNTHHAQVKEFLIGRDLAWLRQ